MDRRGFLGSILILAAAPAIVRAESLMRGRGLVVLQPFSFPEWETVEIDPALDSLRYGQIIQETLVKYQPHVMANLAMNNALLKRLAGRPNPFVAYRSRLSYHNWDRSAIPPDGTGGSEE